MAGLFNADTQLEALLERQRQQNVAQQQQFGQLFGQAAGNRRQAAANTVGAQVGAAFGQGLAGGLFGESEQIKQARQGVTEEEAVQQQLGKIDYNDPESLRSTGSMLIERGLPEAGMRLMQQAIEVGRTRTQATQQQNAQKALANVVKTPTEEAKAKAIEAGVSPQDIKAVSEVSGNNPYVVVGNFVFDKDTGEFLSPPKAAEQQKQKYKVQKIGKDQYGVVNEITGDVKPLESATVEEAEQDKEAFLGTLGKLAQFDQTIGIVDRALEDVEGAGVEYGTLSKLPGNTDSRRLSNSITTLRANLAFDQLQQMRNESKTGGALGQVSNIELGLLESSVEALERIAGTSEEETALALNNVKKHYNNFKNAILGKAPAINWEDPAYNDFVKQKDGVKYWVDRNSGEVWEIGE